MFDITQMYKSELKPSKSEEIIKSVLDAIPKKEVKDPEPTKKKYKKAIELNGEVIELNSKYIDSYEIWYKSITDYKIEDMEESFKQVSKEIQRALSQNKVYNQLNSTRTHLIKQEINTVTAFKFYISKEEDQFTISEYKSLIAVTKEIIRNLKFRRKEDFLQIIEDKKWLKILKQIKESLRINIYEAKLDIPNQETIDAINDVNNDVDVTLLENVSKIEY